MSQSNLSVGGRSPFSGMNIPVLRRLPRRVRLLLFSIFAVVPLTAGLAILMGYTVLAPPPAPFAAAHTIPLTDVNPYGANFFLEREVEAWKRDRTLSMAKAAGITWARQQFPWEEIEPARDQFNWDKYDGIVDLYLKNGIQIIARLDRPPPWARTNASGTGSSGPPDDFDRYGDFVDAFARHYRGKIYLLQIWNEPNLAREWNDAPINPAEYVRLLNVAYKRAKAVDPAIRILTAPLAITLGEQYPNRENAFRNMNDLQFLDEMYAAGAKSSFDILSANAFGLGNPPEDPPDPAKLNFQRVLLERHIMEKNGDANKSVWIDEFGWNAPPASMPDSKLIWGRVTEEQQAAYTVRGIEYARKNWNWVGVISIWFFRQVGDILPNNPESYFRMVDVDFTPRPVYLAVADAAKEEQVAGSGQYEETNPAIQYGGTWAPEVDSRATGDQDLKALGPNDTASIRFSGEGIDLVTRKGPNAGRFIVEVDGNGVSGLPRDQAGKSYIDLSNPTEQWQTTVQVARNLNRGKHTLDLTTVGDVTLDAFIVPELGKAQPPWVVILPLAALGLVSGYLAYQESRARRGT